MAWPTEAGAIAMIMTAGLIGAPTRSGSERGAVSQAAAFRGRHYAAFGAPYRIFNGSEYRVYRRLGEPPRPDDAPYVVSPTLPITCAGVWADGDWYVAMSWFNGVIDSGFLALDGDGNTSVLVSISSGAAQIRPGGPMFAQLTATSTTSARLLVGSWGTFGGYNARLLVDVTEDGSEPSDDPGDADTEISYPEGDGLVIIEQDLTGLTAGARIRARCWNMIVGAGLPGPRIYSLDYEDADVQLPAVAAAAEAGEVLSE